VADFGSHRVRKYDSGGGFVTAFGSFGTTPGRFSSPQGIALDSVGNIFVADTNNHRIQKFDSAGNFLLQWGSAGSALGLFSSPIGIAVSWLIGVHSHQPFNSTWLAIEWSTSKP